MPAAPSLYVYDDAYVDGPSITPLGNSTVILRVGYGSDKGVAGFRRPFFKFDISSVPKYATVTSASLNVTSSGAGTAMTTDLYIWEYSQLELIYALMTSTCTVADPEIIGECAGESWSGGVGNADPLLNGTDIGDLTISALSNTTTSSSVLSKFNEYCQNRENYGNYIQFFLVKRSEALTTNLRSLHSKEASTTAFRPYISYSYQINNTLDGVTEEISNFGGLGQIKFAKNQEDNHMPVIRTVSGSAIEDAPTFISGVPILTSMYNNFRAIHVYKNSQSNDISRQGIRTIYKGISIQTSTTNNIDYYLNTAKEPTIFNSTSPDTEKKILFGNLFIDLDNSNRMLVLEKSGSPLETAKIYIGGNPVIAGRFNDGWAIGIDY